jgi:hypothetical protein
MEAKKQVGLLSRRDFLSGLKKWSKVVIAAAAGVAVGRKASAGAWVNRRGPGYGWGNGGVVWGNGGTVWGNGGGSWGNRGGSWANRGGSWGNGGGGSWVNRHGGGGWVNRYGGGGWLNGRY